ncbi:MAG: hypothetical protein AAGF57_14885 [Pseudomonadota bacterium]
MTEASGITQTSEPHLVAFAGCTLTPINHNMTVVINPANGNQTAVAPQVVETIKACSDFNTIEAHARALAGSRAELQGKEEMIASTLAQLDTAGLLLDARDVCQKLSEEAGTQLAPTRVFIITCDRPEGVTRLLESMQAAGSLSQHDALFLIDDSRNPENRALNREAVAQFNLSSTRDMFYVGEEAQTTLIQGLLEGLPEHAEGIRFLLDREQWQGSKTFGRSRTLSLLLSVGYRALVMDDDVLCRAILPPIRQEGVGLGSGDMRKAAFFPSLESLMNDTVSADFDPLSGHASLLGKSLAGALRIINDGPLAPQQLSGANAALANVLEAQSPILVTQCGSLGDPGTGPHWVQRLAPDSVQRLLSAPQGLRETIENHLCWLGSGRHNVFKMPFMSQVTGLDNSKLLPPYFPAYRGEDALFGAMLINIHNSSVTLEYPWSVPHLPLDGRNVNMDTPIAGSSGVISLLARYLTQRIDYRDRLTPEECLVSMAQDAKRLASRSDRDLLMDYRSALIAGLSDQLQMLMVKYEQSKHTASHEWQMYLKRGIEETQKALVTEQSPTGMGGVDANASEAMLVAEFRRMALGFADVLLGWEQMRIAASDLVDEMIRSRSMYPL